MKKFFKLMCCCLLAVVSILFVGCSKKGNIAYPSTDAKVYGNGGIVVQKGDYMYYVNGYKSHSNITTKDLDDSYSVGGLYVSKLDSNGNLVKDDNGSVSNYDVLSNKLAGYEATNLYIFNDYMYFCSINDEETKSGETQTGRIDFYRIKLDGSNCKKVYRSNSELENVSFQYYSDGSNVYLLVNDNGELNRVVCTNKKIYDESVIDTGIKSIVYLDSALDTINGNYDKVYYTKVNDGIYELYNYNVATDKNLFKISFAENETLELKECKFNHLYFDYASSDGVYTRPTRFYTAMADETNLRNKNFTKLTNCEYDNIYLLESFADGILAISSDKVELIVDATTGPKLILDKTISTMAIDNGYVYYYSGSKIYRVNYLDNNPSEELVCKTFNDEDVLAYNFDFQNGCLYFFSNINSNTYLQRIDVSNISQEEDVVSELVGVMEKGDIPEKTSETEEN